jgi:WhiB family transcriptional regulator, redox-sensing transcriptional regulator
VGAVELTGWPASIDVPHPRNGSVVFSEMKGETVADIARLPQALLDHWEWQLAAACRGMDSSTFFHPSGERDTARHHRAADAKAICRQCPVVEDCLAHALRVREPYGVWGGHSEEERAALLGLRSLRYPAPARTRI